MSYDTGWAEGDLRPNARTREELDRVVAFRQIEAVVVRDQAGRDVPVLFALDASGALWQSRDFGPWERVEQPSDSTAVRRGLTTKGRAAND